MITTRELEHVVAQVNARFEELFKELEKLKAKEEKPSGDTKKGKSKG